MLPLLKESVSELFRYLIQIYGTQGKLIFCFILAGIGNYFTWYCLYGKTSISGWRINLKIGAFRKGITIIA